MERKTEVLSREGREPTRPATVTASEDSTLSAGEVLGRTVLATLPGKVRSESATPGSVRASASTADTGFSVELSPLDTIAPFGILPDAPLPGPAIPLPLDRPRRSHRKDPELAWMSLSIPFFATLANPFARVCGFA